MREQICQNSFFVLKINSLRNQLAIDFLHDCAYQFTRFAAISQRIKKNDKQAETGAETRDRDGQKPKSGKPGNRNKNKSNKNHQSGP